MAAKLLLPVFLICLFFSDPVFAAPDQPGYLSKNDLFTYSMLTYLPLQLADGYHQLQYIPFETRFILRSLPAIGFIPAGEYGKAALFGALPLVAGGISLLDDGNWPVDSIAYVTNMQSAFITEYEVYKSLRGMVSPSETFLYNWQPVNMGDMLLAPLRFDYLADPLVAGVLGALVVGRLLIYGRFMVPGRIYPYPAGEYIKIKDQVFPAGVGTLLFGVEGLYRSWLSGIAEEAFFRGFLFPQISEVSNIWVGAAVSSLIFSFGHWTNKMSFMDNVLAFSFLYMPISLYFSYLAARDHFDFRKAAFVHSWYNGFITIFDVIFGTAGTPPEDYEIRQAGFTLGFRVSY